MSISPSLSSWRCAGPLSGNCWPLRHSAGRSWSYHDHSGAVTLSKFASVAGCCSTATSGTSSYSACFKKVEPRKLLTLGCVSRPGWRRAHTSNAGAERGTSAALRMRAESYTNTICAMSHGTAMPSTGVVKSMTFERLCVVSTKRSLGRACVTGP